MHLVLFDSLLIFLINSLAFVHISSRHCHHNRFLLTFRFISSTAQIVSVLHWRHDVWRLEFGVVSELGQQWLSFIGRAYVWRASWVTPLRGSEQVPTDDEFVRLTTALFEWVVSWPDDADVTSIFIFLQRRRLPSCLGVREHPLVELLTSCPAELQSVSNHQFKVEPTVTSRRSFY